MSNSSGAYRGFHGGHGNPGGIDLYSVDTGNPAFPSDGARGQRSANFGPRSEPRQG